MRVAEQEDDDRADTGLVIVHLKSVSASISMQAVGYDEPLWETTLTALDADLTLAPTLWPPSPPK